MASVTTGSNEVGSLGGEQAAAEPSSDEQREPDSGQRTERLVVMADFVAASNRLPVEIGPEGAKTPSPGGLASALSSLAGGHTAWVGWAGPAAGRLDPFTAGGARLYPVSLSEGEQARYYRGFSNSVLWPLFHGRLRREEMNRAWWRTYRNINERFSVMISRVASPNATVWVHDYHLLLVPKLLRARRPDVRIGLFLHIPFPNAQLFAMLPWRDEVLAGMLGADLIGFQVADDAANFTSTLERLADVKVDGTRVRVGPRTVEVDAFPISVDFARWDELGAAATEGAAAHREELGVESIFLGIDRLDYTKGITQRLQAFCELLDAGTLDGARCAFVQVAVPSRGEVAAYQDERDEVQAWIDRINSDHRRADGSGPVHYLETSLDDVGLAAWYRAADVLVVTSLADGMNLVAKEFVAARVDVDGALVLSEFAGAARDLDGALIVNPYDIDAIKSALMGALELPVNDRRERMRLMRESVRHHDVHHWAEQFLGRLRSTPDPNTRSRMWHLPVLDRLSGLWPVKRS
jgi:alpha,alpha-trehalose-phosphate synthase [UDP-forming]